MVSYISLTENSERCLKYWISFSPTCSRNSRKEINFLFEISFFARKLQAWKTLDSTSSLEFTWFTYSLWKAETRLSISAVMAAWCCLLAACSSRASLRNFIVLDLLRSFWAPCLLHSIQNIPRVCSLKTNQWMPACLQYVKTANSQLWLNLNFSSFCFCNSEGERFMHLFWQW